MPNTGRPSGACYSCRRMKVKCDELTPSCDRCTRANRVCPGYGPKPDRFRYQNPGAPSKKKRLKGRDKQGAKETMAVVLRDSLYDNPEATREDWLQRALHFFFWTTTIPDPDGSAGYFQFLEDYFFSKPHPSYLVDAVHAISLANMSHRARKNSWLMIKALDHRTKALHALRQALGNLDEAREDNVLLSLFLVERFELFYTVNQTPRVWANHAAGISAVLRLRGQQQFKTDLGRHLFRWINGQLATKDLFSGSELSYDDVPDCVFVLERNRIGWQAALPLVKALRRFRGALEMPQGASEQMTNLSELVCDVSIYYESLQSWSCNSFEPYASASKEFSVSGGYDPLTLPIYYFRLFPHIVCWNNYWSTRFRTIRLYLDCRQTLLAYGMQDHFLHSEEVLLDQLAECSDCICGLVASCLEQVESPDEAPPSDPLQARGSFTRALYSMACVNLVAGTHELDILRPGMRQWALDCLLQLSSVYGNRQANAFYEYYSNLVPPQGPIHHHFMVKPRSDDNIYPAISLLGLENQQSSKPHTDGVETRTLLELEANSVYPEAFEY